MQEFEREYCHEVKSACLQAIANTSFCERANPRDILPAAEIKVALIDIMGTITAMVEESLPRDMQEWAEGLAAQFEACFHTTRASLTSIPQHYEGGLGPRSLSIIPPTSRNVSPPHSGAGA